MNQSISIVGCGWMGFPLAKALVARGLHVKGSTTSEEKLDRLLEEGIAPYLFKLEDRAIGRYEDLFKSEILVINIPPGRGRHDVLSRYPNEIELILEEAKAGNIKYVVYVSSTGVYKNTNDLIDEGSHCEPSRPSSQAVLIAEEMVRKSGISFSIIRMSGLVGGDRQPGYWFEGQSNLPAGETPVNMIHRDDCIRALKIIIEQQPENQVYNMCADLHPVKREFYKAQSKKLGLTPPSFQNGVGPHKIVENSKFKIQFGFEYEHPNPLEF